MPRLPDTIEKEIKIDIGQNLTNIEQDEASYYYEILLRDEDGPSPIYWSCSRLNEVHSYFLKYQFKNKTLSLIFNKKALVDVKFDGSFEIKCIFNDKYSLKHRKQVEKVPLKIEIAQP